MMKVKPPLGIDIFKDVCTSGSYYIDKTGFIKELLEEEEQDEKGEEGRWL